MDPLDFLEPEELLQFFHCKKTVMSCMENPQTFLTQLRDHDLIPKDRFQKLYRMTSKETLKRGVYELLDCLERERPEDIRLFWSCVFENPVISQYQTLRDLRDSLLDGSFRVGQRLPDEQTHDKGKKLPDEEGEEEEKHLNTRTKKKRRKPRSREASGDEQPGPSSPPTPGPKRKKRSKKISFSSPLKKGEKGEGIWTWPIFKSQLPVTCGDLQGLLNRDRLAKGKKCILFQKQWLTPTKFETQAGEQSSGNWKLSIRCRGVPLGQLIQEGHLTSGEHEGGCKAVKKSLFPSEEFTDEDEEAKDQASSHEGSSPGGTEAETEGQKDAEHSRKVFKVTCGGVTGTLHKIRFASGTCGKSIRTETRWLSPAEFVKEASGRTDAAWNRDIQCEGKPLGVLIDENILTVHKQPCECKCCRPDERELENQKNDDECFVCKGNSGRELVVCDECPRSFHQRCHLPRVAGTALRDNGKWICTFCVFESVQQCRYSDELMMEAAMSQDISQHMMECQYLLLCLFGADEEQMFAQNPRLYLKNYAAVIQTPMWFEKIANNLEKERYRTVGEFVSDVRLIFTNCSTYNRANAEILELGRRLKQLFDEEFKKVFSISESTADS